ncbi:hypothetical protein P7C71_g3835, partial [Lecanoromycetidae sp. Uapishka_2]
MASSLTASNYILCLLACVLCVNAINNTNATGTHPAPAVILDNEANFAVCVYPRSGTYSFLSRLLYYCTLIFSLFSRAHLWLVAGALASALVYAGSAAVHACLLVWRGPNPYIENDSWALYAILNAACLITVPLLNWSGTLRRLGQRAASLKDHKGLRTNGDVGTRTIVIYWAFLVLVGYICIWQQTRYGESDLDNEYPDMAKVMCLPGTNASMLMSSNGTYHRRAIDNNFIQDNGCTDPCNLHEEQEPEHGIAEGKEMTTSSSERDSNSVGRRTSVEEMPSNRSSPTQEKPQVQQKQKASTNILDTIKATYRAGCDPLNQTGNGPFDEMRNFYRWCKNPQEVSRLVIRHPIRVSDTKFIDAPPAVVDANKDDPRAQDHRNSFFRGASVEHHRDAV